MGKQRSSVSGHTSGGRRYGAAAGSAYGDTAAAASYRKPRRRGGKAFGLEGPEVRLLEDVSGGGVYLLLAMPESEVVLAADEEVKEFFEESGEVYPAGLFEPVWGSLAGVLLLESGEGMRLPLYLEDELLVKRLRRVLPGVEEEEGEDSFWEEETEEEEEVEDFTASSTSSSSSAASSSGGGISGSSSSRGLFDQLYKGSSGNGEEAAASEVEEKEAEGSAGDTPPVFMID